MLKKEVSEVKKQLNITECSFTRLCGCYVHGEEKEKDTFETAFLSIPEDDIFKYFEVFKKTLSGSLNKNLHGIQFGIHNDSRELLQEVVSSKLKDPAMLEKFYDMVIETYHEAGNYVILLAHNIYDVPGKASDGLTMDDASDEIYEYIQCAICPVSLSDPGLGYKAPGTLFSSVKQNWIIHKPECGFLYPAFNDRRADLSEALYYCSSTRNLKAEFLQEFFQEKAPFSAEEQKDGFCRVIEESFSDGMSYSCACAVKESIDELLTEAAEYGEQDSVTIQKKDLKAILETAGEEDFDEAAFERVTDEIDAIDGGLNAGNLSDTKSFDIKTENIQIKVNPKKFPTPEIRIVEGRKYIIIPVEGDLLVNGIVVTK